MSFDIHAHRELVSFCRMLLRRHTPVMEENSPPLATNGPLEKQILIPMVN